jgi:hypothetical protein
LLQQKTFARIGPESIETFSCCGKKNGQKGNIPFMPSNCFKMSSTSVTIRPLKFFPFLVLVPADQNGFFKKHNHCRDIKSRSRSDLREWSGNWTSK